MFQKLLLLTAVISCGLTSVAHGFQASTVVPPAPPVQDAGSANDSVDLVKKASFLVGYNFVKQLKAEEIGFDFAKMLEGAKQACDEVELDMSPEQILVIMEAFDVKVRKDLQERFAREADENKRAGDAFLKENRLNEGVLELENGLQYSVMQVGNGVKSLPTDSVLCHYKGHVSEWRRIRFV